MMRTFVTLVALLALALQNQSVRADCSWFIKTDLPDPQPLYINPKGPNNVNGFWLPEYDDVVIVPTGEQVLFACPGGFLTATGTPEALLTCVDGASFADEQGNNFFFYLLSCSSNPITTARRVAGASCAKSTNNSLVEIGFQLSSGPFYTILETCFNDLTYDSLYSKNIMTRSIAGRQTGLPDPNNFWTFAFYPPTLDLDLQYSIEGQTAAVANAVGPVLAGLYISGKNVLKDSRLTAKRDDVYGSHQWASFWYLNVAPQWGEVNNGNWDDLQTFTRDFAATRTNDLTVYTGTHGTTTLADNNGVQQPIYIAYDDNGSGILRVPEFFWRVVYDETTQEGVAFVSINNPYITAPGSEFYLCPDVCSQISWVSWFPEDQKLGFSYCCEVGELAKFVEEIPELTVTGLLR